MCEEIVLLYLGLWCVVKIFMSVFVFCVNLLHRLLFVISVYFTLHILLLFVFFHVKAICGK